MSSIFNPTMLNEVDSMSYLREIDIILAAITLLLGASVTWFGPKHINVVFFLATMVSTSIITEFFSYTVVRFIPLGLALIVTFYKPMYKTGIFIIGFSSAGYVSSAVYHIIMAVLTTAPNAVILVSMVVCGIASLVAMIYSAVRALQMNPRLLRMMICTIGGFATSSSLNHLLSATVFRNLYATFAIFIVGGALLTLLAWRYQPVVETNYQIAEVPAATPKDDKTDYAATV